MQKPSLSIATLKSAIQLASRAALAAAIAVVIAHYLHLQYPIYALISAVIVTDLSPSHSRHLAVQRLAGTVLGATVGAAFSYFTLPSPWMIGLSILTAMFISHLSRLQGADKLTGYICGVVVLEHSAYAWSYALHRLMETMLGIGAAVLVSFIPKLWKDE